MNNISEFSCRPNSFNVSFFDEDKARRNYRKDRTYVVGYARLSFDEDGGGYVSILNQKSILDSVYNKDFDSAKSEYVFIDDDNISGYKFDRPGFFRLLSLIEQGKCNVIIAKDLSRIGRHSALTQLFIEQCERVGIRIKAMEDYDSNKESDEIILGIKAWSNERIVKDTSAKISKVIAHRQEEGTWFCAAPVGYIANYQKKTIEVDERAKEILLRIADMFLVNDWGINKIARVLTDEGVPTPSVIERDRFLAEGKEYKKTVSNSWNAFQIATILDNDFYNGVFRTGKYTRNGINGADIRKDPSEHNVFINHHEKIFSDELFTAIRNKREKRKKENFRRKENTENIFHGIVYCGDCGNVMYAYKRPNLDPQYVCSQYFKYGTKYCSRHMIKAKTLEQYTLDLLQHIKNECPNILESLNAEVNAFRKVKKGEGFQDSGKIKQQIEKLKAELTAIESQRIKQIIARPNNEMMINDIYDKMFVETQAKIDELTAHLSMISQYEQDARGLVKKAKTAIDIINMIVEEGEVKRADIEALFEKITVYENGDVDIQLVPDLQILGIANQSMTVERRNHPNQHHEFNNVNEVREGDPQLTTFIQLATAILGLEKITKQFVKNRGYSN